MPELNLDDINKAVKDSAYAAVGFGVLSFQRAQVRRRELTEQIQNLTDQLGNGSGQFSEQINEQLTAAREQLTELAKVLDERVAPVRRQFDARVDELEGRLPASTRNTFASLRSTARAPEKFLRQTVGL